MSQLLLRLHQVTQRLGSSSSSSSVLQVTAVACTTSSSCGIWTASIWQQQQQQQHQGFSHHHHQQHLPLQQQQQHFSTCAAAADAALLSLQTAPQLPCMLTNKAKQQKGLRSSNVIRYPYPLPPQYSSRQWQLRGLDGRALGAVELPGSIFNVPVRVDILHQVVRWQRAKARQGTHKTKDRSEVRGGGKKPWQQKGSGRARAGSIRAPQWRGGGIVHGPVPRSHAFDLPRKVRRLGLKCALSAKANEGRLILVDSLTPAVPKTRFMAARLTNLVNTQAAAASALSAGLVGGGGSTSSASSSDAGLSNVLLQQLQRWQRDGGVELLGCGAAAAGEESAEQQQAAGVRVSAVLIDSSKQGDDGGALMRRAVGNLPGIEVVPAIGANVLSLLRRDYVIMTKPGLDAVISRLNSPINRLGAAGLAFRQKLTERRAAAAGQRLLERRLARTPAPAAAGAGGGDGGGSSGN